MVQAVRKPKLVDQHGATLRSETSVAAMMPGVALASRRAQARANDKEAARRAKLMSTAKCSVYVSENVPEGNFTIIDPDALEAGDKALCPFKVKTLVVNPDDIDRAIAHFEAQKINAAV